MDDNYHNPLLKNESIGYDSRYKLEPFGLIPIVLAIVCLIPTSILMILNDFGNQLGYIGSLLQVPYHVFMNVLALLAGISQIIMQTIDYVLGQNLLSDLIKLPFNLFPFIVQTLITPIVLRNKQTNVTGGEFKKILPTCSNKHIFYFGANN